MELIWGRVCEETGVNTAVSQEWLERIRSNYSDESRVYHNWEMLSSKLMFLGDQPACVVFAVVFQYYEFDLRKNCIELNCEAFRKFCEKGAIQNVSLLKNSINKIN